MAVNQQIMLLVVLPADLELVHTNHRFAEEGDHERIALFFEVKKWKGKFVNAEPHLCDDLAWFALDNLPQHMAPEVRYCLEQIANKIPYSSMNFM
jgi:8-oxo-dGTP diphosphatase